MPIQKISKKVQKEKEIKNKFRITILRKKFDRVSSLNIIKGVYTRKQILLWSIYTRHQISYIPFKLYLKQELQKKIEQRWKKSLKRIMQLPKSTEDESLQLIQGNCLNLAIEQQWNSAIKCESRLGLEIIEEEDGKSKKHLEYQKIVYTESQKLQRACQLEIWNKKPEQDSFNQYLRYYRFYTKIESICEHNKGKQSKKSQRSSKILLNNVYF